MIYHDGLSGVSSQLTGRGTYDLSSFVFSLLPAPLDGGILWHFDIVAWVEAFNDDVIWNSNSGNRDQLRGGRFIVANDFWDVEECFINRRFNRVERLTYIDADNQQSDVGVIGSGKYVVPLQTAGNLQRYVSRIYYHFEPSVVVRFFIQGGLTFLVNEANDTTFEIAGYVEL